MRKREPLRSPVREYRTPGSVRGSLGNWRSYRDCPTTSSRSLWHGMAPNRPDHPSAIHAIDEFTPLR